MSKQIFYDPQRKRWKRLRRVFDLLALFGAITGILFIVGMLRIKPMRGLDLRSATKRYRALSNPPVPELRTREKLNQSAHRKTDLKPSDVVLNTTEGLRAAFYTDVDPASYASLKEHVKEIDLLFPEWLHVITPDGHLTAFSADNTPFPVIDNSGVHGVDRENKVARVINSAKEDTEIFPMVNNYNPKEGVFEDNVGQFLSSADARANFLRQVDRFMAANTLYRGLTLDFQAFGPQDQANYNQLIAALYTDFHPRNLRLYVNVPVSASKDTLSFIGSNSDGIVLMDYDQHQTGTQPGPIAGQDWFANNLRTALSVVPRQKIICSIGNYAYDWSTPLPTAAAPPGPQNTVQTKRNRAHLTRRVKTLPLPPEETDLDAVYMSTQEAWQAASDSEAKIDLDDASLNPHFAYIDEDAHVRHQIWLLDAVSALNEMRVARALGLQTFALWRLGSEDASIWNIWDNPLKIDPAKALADIAPGWDVDTEGDGDILRVTKPPQNGHRSITMDDDTTIPSQYLSAVSESMDKYPLPYTVSQYGYHPKEIAITFDDGPDPTWTPKILDILKRYHVVGTFFIIGEEAEDNVSTLKRVYREGHEIGNHTFTHPDISEISERSVDLQLNLTERLFAAKLGVQPVYFRPPYSIDQEPDTNDQATPIEHIQQLGYTIIGNRLSTASSGRSHSRRPRPG
jgi:spore germination protein YaaH